MKISAQFGIVVPHLPVHSAYFFSFIQLVDTLKETVAGRGAEPIVDIGEVVDEANTLHP